MSSLPWFRLYHRIIDDEKLRLLAFEDRWHFVALCCLKADGLLDEQRGPLWERKVAVKLGVQLRELDEISRRLQEVGLIDGQLNPVAWDELQYKSDNSTARVKAFRERQQKQGGNDVKRFSNVAVTAQETDTESDTEETPKGVCADKAAPEPDDFTFDDFIETWNEVAREHSLGAIKRKTEPRRRAFNARKREYPDINDWKAAFRCLQSNKWMHGDNKTGWRADPDFFLQAKSFTKLVENQYGQAER
jgi:hypothetical protein